MKRLATAPPVQSTPQGVSATQADQAESRAVLTVAAARSFCLLTSVRLRRDDPQSPQLPKLAVLTNSLDRLINAGQTTLPLYVPPQGVRALNTDDVHASVTAALAHLPSPQPIVFDLLGARELLRSWSGKLDSTKGQLTQANLQALAMLDALGGRRRERCDGVGAAGDFSIARLRAAHAGITAAHRALELKAFEQEHAAKAEIPEQAAQRTERAPAPARDSGEQRHERPPQAARVAAAPTPLRRSQAGVHELTLGELKEKCQDILASLDRAIIEHERTLQSLGALSTTSGNKITWQLPQPRAQAELVTHAYAQVGGQWLATARAEADAAQHELQLLEASQAKAGKVAGALLGWRMRDTKAKVALAAEHLAEVTTWLGKPEQASAIATLVLSMRAQDEKALVEATSQLKQLATVTKARKAYYGLARELKGLTNADLRQSITLQGTTVNELVHDEHARRTLSNFVEQRQREQAFKREAGLNADRGLSA